MIVTLIFPSIIMPALQPLLPLSSVFSWRLFNFSDTMFYNTRCKVQTMVPIVQFDVNKFLLVENWEPRSESNFRLRREFADWKLTIYLSEVNFTRGGFVRDLEITIVFLCQCSKFETTSCVRMCTGNETKDRRCVLIKTKKITGEGGEWKQEEFHFITSNSSEREIHKGNLPLSLPWEERLLWPLE